MRIRILQLLAVVSLVYLPSAKLWGQVPLLLNQQLPAGVPVLLQGEEIKLPEDFVARLDGDQLKVALKSFGLEPLSDERELLVTLIQDDGSKTELKPDVDGTLVFDKVKAGLASLIVTSGRAAYAAIPFYAAPSLPASPARTFDVPLASIEPGLIREGLDAADASGETVQVAGAAKKLSDYKSGGVNRFQVSLQSDGTLLGRVIVPQVGYEREIGGIDLTFYRNEKLVGKTSTADDGTFSVAGLQPAIHSVFAIGAAGHSAFSFEVVGSFENVLPLTDTQNSSTGRLVSTGVVPTKVVSTLAQGTPSNELIVLIIPPRMMQQVRETVRSSYPASSTPSNGLAGGPGGSPGLGSFGNAPGMGSSAMSSGSMGSGGAGGGGMGGGAAGGAAGGIGGLGGLLGIAGLAAGVSAISNDSTGNGNLATPVTPSSSN